MFNRKLKKRIKSLEEYLSISYISPEDRDYPQHIDNSVYGINNRIDRLEKKIKGK